MCGFIGFKHSGKADWMAKALDTMTDTIIHRGPDDSGCYIDDDIAIGFRRLSIIDLSSNGHQPFIKESAKLILSFNGEIYNYKELRHELIELGYHFNTESEGEVLLNGYDCFGIDMLKKLRGMFAIVIWDGVSENLYLARDPFGIKPLYYYYNESEQTFIFGSEIKSFIGHPSFKKELNHQALKPYLTFQYSSLNETFFKGVYKVKPSHYLSYKQGEIIEEQYEHLEFRPNKLSLNENVNLIHESICDSVDYHKISDVEVGAFLSGGVDSSYITSVLRPKKTFTVGFSDYEGIFNESHLAEDLSKRLGIDHYVKIIHPDEFFEIIPKIQYHMDEPHANLSAVPLYFLSELASKHVKVVLSGEGADELFGGYDWYKKSHYLELYQKTPLNFRRAIAKQTNKLPSNRITTFLNKAAESIEESFVGQAKVFSEVDADLLLKEKYRIEISYKHITQPHFNKVRNQDDLTKMQYLDIHQWLPGDILQKADKMSMAHSIELRVPFLDKQVLSIASELPVKHRVKAGNTKVGLRKAASKLLDRDGATRQKVGFPVPIRFWLREERYYEMVKMVFNEKFVEEFFDSHLLNKYLDDHRTGLANHARYIYTVYVFLIWYKEYFEESINS